MKQVYSLYECSDRAACTIPHPQFPIPVLSTGVVQIYLIISWRSFFANKVRNTTAPRQATHRTWQPRCAPIWKCVWSILARANRLGLPHVLCDLSHRLSVHQSEHQLGVLFVHSVNQCCQMKIPEILTFSKKNPHTSNMGIKCKVFSSRTSKWSLPSP